MKAHSATTPVFADESGVRARLLLWLARGVCACLVVVTGAVVLTLTTDVRLPGLGGPATPRTETPPARTPLDTEDVSDPSSAPVDQARPAPTRAKTRARVRTDDAPNRGVRAASAGSVVRQASVTPFVPSTSPLPEPASSRAPSTSSQTPSATPAPSPSPSAGSESAGAAHANPRADTARDNARGGSGQARPTLPPSAAAGDRSDRAEAADDHGRP